MTAPVTPCVGWTRTPGDPATSLQLYLGCHRPTWTDQSDVPLFVSMSTIADRRDPWFRGPWALDSGGFTELQRHGEWRDHPQTYGARVARLIAAGLRPDFVAPQDWMCEPIVREGGTAPNGWHFAGTGLTVRDHQELTVDNLLYLREEFDGAGIPWMPVLQGWTLTEYLDCIDLYEAAGINLADEHRVGLGSVCRRQATAEIGAIVAAVTARVPGIRLHGFGVKKAGIERYGHMLASADSMAWSYAARQEGRRNGGRPSLPDCEHTGPCTNCFRYAVAWRDEVLESLRRPTQLGFELPFDTEEIAA